MRKKTILSIILVFMLLFGIVSLATAEKKTYCDGCGKRITGQYIKTEKQAWHAECFVCSRCGDKITGQFNTEGRDLYHPDCYKREKNLICDICGKILGSEWMAQDDKKYHKSCYKDQVQVRCDICGKLVYGKWVTDDDGQYHPNCFRNHKLPKCSVCMLPVEGESLLDIWGNRSHPKHRGKEPLLCESCGRIVSRRTSEGGRFLNDGRLSCGICSKNEVVNNTQIKGLSKRVRDILEDVGVVIPDGVPVSLVSTGELEKIAAADYSHNTSGYTKSKAKIRKDEVVSVSHRVYVLHSLPEAHFAGVLAHEYLHVWLNERAVTMSSEEVEGFCNLGTMLVNHELQTPLTKVLDQKMDENPDPVYGEGYRDQKRRLDRIGWKKMLRYMAANGLKRK